MDLGRIELPSKRGNHMLSTCLSLPSFFEYKQDQSHQLVPYPLKSHNSIEACCGQSRFACTTLSDCFGTRASGWCLVPAPGAGIKLIYCTSIKQREHKKFRQIIVAGSDYSANQRGTACLRTFSTRCQIQIAPVHRGKWPRYARPSFLRFSLQRYGNFLFFQIEFLCFFSFCALF